MLKLEICTETLLTGLNLASRVSGVYSSMPILANILLKAENGKLSIKTTDLELTYAEDYEAEVGEPGEICVPAKVLFNLIKSLKAETVTIVEQENRVLNILAGKFKAELLGVSTDGFPKIDAYKLNPFCTIKPEILIDYINKVVYSVAKGNSNFNLAGIHFRNFNNILVLESTDNNRLNIVETNIQLEDQKLLPNGFIVSQKGITELKTFCQKNAKQDIELSINEMGNMFVATAENKGLKSSLAAKLLDGKYPNTENLLNRESYTHANVGTFDKKDLLTTLKRLSIIMSDKINVLYFNFNDEKILVKTQNPEVGQGEEILAGKYIGQDIYLGISPSFLEQALNSLNSEVVRIELKTAKNPVLLTGDDDLGFWGLITTVLPGD